MSGESLNSSSELQEVFGEGERPLPHVQASDQILPRTIAYSMCRQACSSAATTGTFAVLFARPTRICLQASWMKPKLFTTLDILSGVRAERRSLRLRRAGVIIVRAGRMMRYTFPQSKNSPLALHDTNHRLARQRWRRSIERLHPNIYSTPGSSIGRGLYNHEGL